MEKNNKNDIIGTIDADILEGYLKGLQLKLKDELHANRIKYLPTHAQLEDITETVMEDLEEFNEPLTIANVTRDIIGWLRIEAIVASTSMVENEVDREAEEEEWRSAQSREMELATELNNEER